MTDQSPATPYSLPSHLHPATTPSTSNTPTSRKKLKQRLDFLPFPASSSSRRENSGEDGPAPRERVRGEKKWWQMLGKGMINDVKRRAPFYKSDWVDAWDYRVVPATVYMYFAK